MVALYLYTCVKQTVMQHWLLRGGGVTTFLDEPLTLETKLPNWLQYDQSPL